MMWAKAKPWAKIAFVAPFVLLLCGFGIGTLVSAPSYAVVYVDDAAKTTLAPQCAGAWKRAAGFGLLRRTTLGEANARRYKLDHDCIEAGAFSQDGPSVTGLILQYIGLLPRRTYWWDQPFRTEAGVIYPGKSGPQVTIAADPDGEPVFCYQGLPGKSGVEKFNLTPEQLDICAHFAQQHMKAAGVVQTETPDQLIGRWNDENGLCSVPARDTSGAMRKPTSDEVSQCVVNHEMARIEAEVARKRAEAKR
ncbi:MAG TPA: hypothetical protein VF459_10045 [Caulobacteraceae bacterium]